MLTGSGPWWFRDQSRAALPGEVRPEPLPLHPQAVLQLRKRHDVQEDPDEPGEKPAHVQASALQDGEVLADHRHVTLVEIAEWTLRPPSAEFERDQASDIVPLLNRGLRHTRHWSPIALDR